VSPTTHPRSVTRIAAATLAALALAAPAAMARPLGEPPISAPIEREGSASDAPPAALAYSDVESRQTERMAAIAKALSDPARLQLVDVLRKHAGPVCGCELTPLLGLSGFSPPTVSHHLNVLRDAGLVDSERRGLWAFYYLASDALPVTVRATDESVDWDPAGIVAAATGGLVLGAVAGFATARRARIRLSRRSPVMTLEATPKEESADEG
jgi:ArsR family transcriptional regulator, arsenate/arsenite/antimonite-responsive transcriptional repressor